MEASTTVHVRPARSGLGRSIRLFRLFLGEQTDPDHFYREVAADAVSQVEQYATVAGRTVFDIGGGPGHFTAAFRDRGGACCLFEPDLAELLSRGERPAFSVLADGYRLPVRDGTADICFSSNVLEHVPDPHGFIDEMVRVTRVGGLIYLAYTNWYSPWGGHEMSPWHYLGTGFAERRYVRRHGRLPKNRCGTGLFPVHVGPMLRALRARGDVELVDALPRYHPPWSRMMVRVPWLREVATWNLLVILRRAGEVGSADGHPRNREARS